MQLRPPDPPPAEPAEADVIRAVLFDAGHTLLECDYVLLTAQLVARGHDVSQPRVVEAEGRARIRPYGEQAAQPTRARLGAGRYLRYLLGGLGITAEEDVAAITAWRRGFNLPVGLCHQGDAQAVDALTRLRAAGVVTGVISNSNGSVRQALERAVSPRCWTSSSTPRWSASRSPIPGCLPWDSRPPAWMPARRSTSGTRTSWTWSARAAPGWAPSCSIRGRVGSARLSQRGGAERGGRPRYRSPDVVSRTATI
jgi:hypothetical protein